MKLSPLKLSPRQRMLMASGPLVGALALALRQAHVFGAGDLADAIYGAFTGAGVGLALGVLVLRKRCP